METPPNPTPGKAVERLFPFVLKSRSLIIGQDTLMRSKDALEGIDAFLEKRPAVWSHA